MPTESPMPQFTVIKDWTIYRVLSPTGARAGRAAHIVGIIEDHPDPSRIGEQIISAQLMDIDLRRGRVGTHYQDIYLSGDGNETWITIDEISRIKQDLPAP